MIAAKKLPTILTLVLFPMFLSILTFSSDDVGAPEDLSAEYLEQYYVPR
jgi:hypothetical protein